MAVDYSLVMPVPGDEDKASVAVRPNDGGEEVRLSITDRFTSVTVIITRDQAAALGHFLLGIAQTR